MTDQEELATIAADLQAHLEWLRASHLKDVPAVPRLAAEPAGAKAPPPMPAEAPAPQGSIRDAVRGMVGAAPLKPAKPAGPKPIAAAVAPPKNFQGSPQVAMAASVVARPAPVIAKLPPPIISGDRTLEDISKELGPCTRCKLCGTRKTIVFGAGNPKAQLVFVGEGPGADEDRQGIPFVGAAGQLLTKMIEAMGFSRDEVYLCNVVKCRPPGNRNPEPDEIAACEPFLKAQLASLSPKVIVTLGKFAAQALLRTDSSMTRLRGTWSSYEGIKVMPTFHPSYLLRQEDEKTQNEEKKKVWSDLKLVMKEFGREPKKPG